VPITILHCLQHKLGFCWQLTYTMFFQLQLLPARVQTYIYSELGTLNEVRKFELWLKHLNSDSFSDPLIFICCSVKCLGSSLITLAWTAVYAYSQGNTAITSCSSSMKWVVEIHSVIVTWPFFLAVTKGPCMAHTWGRRPPSLQCGWAHVGKWDHPHSLSASL